MNSLLTAATEDPRLRLRLNSGVSYSSDVFHVRDVALRVAAQILYMVYAFQSFPGRGH